MKYDAMGRMIQSGSTVPRMDGTNVMTGYTGLIQMTYDSQGNLTSETRPFGSGTHGNTLTWDANGNLTLFNGTSHTYNANSQITSAGHTFNGRGEQTSLSGNAMTYDAQGRIVSIGGITSRGPSTIPRRGGRGCLRRGWGWCRVGFRS